MYIHGLLLASIVSLAASRADCAQDMKLNDNAPVAQSTYDYALNDLVTDSIVKDLRAVRTECLNSAEGYRLDCLRQGLELTSRRAPYHGDYGQMRRALHQGAQDIIPVISENSSADHPRLEVKPGTNPRFKARRYYTFVAIDRDPSAKRSAVQALDGARSKLSEAGQASATWSKHYTAVATAMASLSDLLP